MDAMVTARVPVEVKEQVNTLLRETGSSPTELINAAYDYFLHYRQLPQICADTGPVCITLTPSQIQELRARTERSTCSMPPGFWESEFASFGSSCWGQS